MCPQSGQRREQPTPHQRHDRGDSGLDEPVPCRGVPEQVGIPEQFGGGRLLGTEVESFRRDIHSRHIAKIIGAQTHYSLVGSHYSSVGAQPPRRRALRSTTSASGGRQHGELRETRMLQRVIDMLVQLGGRRPAVPDRRGDHVPVDAIVQRQLESWPITRRPYDGRLARCRWCRVTVVRVASSPVGSCRSVGCCWGNRAPTLKVRAPTAGGSLAHAGWVVISCQDTDHDRA